MSGKREYDQKQREGNTLFGNWTITKRFKRGIIRADESQNDSICHVFAIKSRAIETADHWFVKWGRSA